MLLNLRDLKGPKMCAEAHESYVNKCCFFGVMPTPKEELERNECTEDREVVYDNTAKAFVHVNKKTKK